MKLSEWVIFEPPHANWPELEWARAIDQESADWLLSAHRFLWPTTIFEMRQVEF